MRYLIEVEVNEDKLRMSSEADGGESVESLILSEMGWVDESGIRVSVVRKSEPEVSGPYTAEMLAEAISNIISQDGDDKTDGQCIDEIIELLDKHELRKNK